MDPFSAEQLQKSSFVNSVVVRSELASTNCYAKELVQSRNLATPSVVIAITQTAGRGRRDKSWWSGPGSLTFTLVLEKTKLVDGLVSIAAAIAVSESVRAFVPTLNPLIKWPNDVLVDGKKICGILIEVIAAPSPVALVGIGVNTNCRMNDINQDLGKPVTSLLDETNQPIDQQQFLIELLGQLNKWIIGSRKKGIIDTFMNISQFKSGQPIRVESPQITTIVGQFVGIGMSGELILSVDGKSVPITSGSIIDGI